jgi:hypothetical protein
MSASIFFPGSSNANAATATAKAAATEDSIWEALKPVSTIKAHLGDGHYCEECKTGEHIVVDDDEVACIACGTHLGYLMDSSAEYR